MQPNHCLVQLRCPTPLCPVRLAATDAGLAGLWFEDQRHRPEGLDGPKAWPVNESHRLLREAAAQLQSYFAGQRQHFDLPLDLRAGTAFQQAVWGALRAIAPGQTQTYGGICRAIGKPQAARAVGAAIGRNPLGIIVPCHRVLGQGGSLTGYAGGLARKSALLQLEGVRL